MAYARIWTGAACSAERGEQPKVGATMQNISAHACRWLARFVLLGAACVVLASCDTPVGVSPALKGTYWEHAIVTNPYGGGPMEVRWGPPDPYLHTRPLF